MRSPWLAFAVAVGLALSGYGHASGEDDLAVVKRAVARADVSPGNRSSISGKARQGERPRFVKVRIVEKRTGRAKVSVNVPLGLVRLADDWPIRWDCRKAAFRHRCVVTVSEILGALESGEDIVQIDDEDASVRVWVE